MAKYRKGQNVKEDKIQRAKYKRKQNIEGKIQRAKYSEQNIEDKIKRAKYREQNIEVSKI